MYKLNQNSSEGEPLMLIRWEVMVPDVSGLDAERIIRRNIKKKKVSSLLQITSGCKATTSIKKQLSENEADSFVENPEAGKIPVMRNAG